MEYITHLRNNKERIFFIAVFLSLFTIVTTTQQSYDKLMHSHDVFKTETRYILPPAVVKLLSFGFNNVLSDFYWVSAVQDFNIWDGKDPFYVREFQNISALDPHFSYPYLLAILTVTSKDNKEALDNIEPLIESGIKNLPTNWEIPFYFGTGYQITKTPDKALHYLSLAASYPNVPEQVKSVYKNLLTRNLTQKEIAHGLVQTIYTTTDSETTKKIMREGIIAQDLGDIITGIVQKYKRTYGTYPSSIYDLAQHHMVIMTPLLRNDFTVFIDPTTGKVTVTPQSTK